MDTTYYYPCSVYLREGGVPLGRIDEDDLKMQQKKIIRFVEESNCLEDPICREYCINCCRQFNQFANWRMHKSALSGEGMTFPIQSEIDLKDRIDPKEVERMINILRNDSASLDSSERARPFIVIKPSGMKHKCKILAVLMHKKIRVEMERTIPAWYHTSLRIYCVPPSEANVRRGLMIDLAFQEEESSASLLILQDDVTIGKLKSIKDHINKMLSPHFCLIRQGDNLVVTLKNYVHTPDNEDWAREYSILMKSSIEV
jgi:hypothetical protein